MKLKILSEEPPLDGFGLHQRKRPANLHNAVCLSTTTEFLDGYDWAFDRLLYFKLINGNSNRSEKWRKSEFFSF